MAHGFSLTRHDGLEQYAEALVAAGAAVVVFDHRYLGDSGGTPRQRFRVEHQRQDYRAAVNYARRLDGVDGEQIIIWGFSFSGGTAVEVAAADARIAGLILLCPFLDGLARVMKAAKSSPGLVAWILPRALKDKIGAHTLISVTGQPGEHAAMTFPGEAEGIAAAVASDSPWRNEISPGLFLTLALYRPVSRAARIGCPTWIGLGERDITVSNPASEKFAAASPRAELHRYDVDHFGAFHEPAAEQIRADQAEWLNHLTQPAR